MRRASVLADKMEPVAIALIAIFALHLCLSAVRLSGENIQLVRHGVMVDPTECESAARDVSWQASRTWHFDLYIEQGVDLNTVERNLRKRLFLISHPAGSGAGIENDIARRLDAICDRAMDILDMHPKMARRAIKIFKNNSDLNTTYLALTGKSGNVRAFYAHDCSVIYTSEDEITDSVMAHEIAHLIVDSYYKGIPPPKVGEMFASYVDMHISE